jgi:hypothetical protein
MSLVEKKNDEMSVDEMSVDEMSVDKMSVDEMACHHRLISLRFRSFVNDD